MTIVGAMLFGTFLVGRISPLFGESGIVSIVGSVPCTVAISQEYREASMCSCGKDRHGICRKEQYVTVTAFDSVLSASGRVAVCSGTYNTVRCAERDRGIAYNGTCIYELFDDGTCDIRLIPRAYHGTRRLSMSATPAAFILASVVVPMAVVATLAVRAWIAGRPRFSRDGNSSECTTV